MTDNVIQQFLVSIGIDIDEEGAKKIDKATDDIEKGLKKVAEAAAATMAAVAVTIAKVADDFDKLYWMSKNVGSTVGDIKKLEYAFSQLGLSAGDADSALKSIANFKLTYGQGAIGFLTQHGVDPNDIGDSVKTLRDLEVTFRNMVRFGGPNGEARANNLATYLGLSSDQFRAMIRDTGEFEAQYGQMAKRLGIDLDGLGDKSNDFMTKYRAMKAELGLAVDVGVYKALEKAMPYLEDFTKYLENLPADQLQTAGDIIVGTLGAIALAATAAYAPFIALAGAIAIALKAEQDWEKGDAWIKFRHETPEDRKKRQDDPANPYGKGLLGGLKAMWHSDWLSVRHDDASVPTGAAPHPAMAAGAAARESAQAVIGYFKSHGVGDVQAQGLAAMLYSENTKFDPNANNLSGSGAHGLAQWLDKSRLADFRRLTGHDLSRSTFSEQLNFIAYELTHRFRPVWESMKRAESAYEVARIGIRGFEAPGPAGILGDEGRARTFLGGGGVAFNQTNNFNNHGANPTDLTTNIMSDQKYANQQLMIAASKYQW